MGRFADQITYVVYGINTVTNPLVATREIFRKGEVEMDILNFSLALSSPGSF